MTKLFLALAVIPLAAAIDSARYAPAVLPPRATIALDASLKAADAHAKHIWRDTPAMNADRTINAFVEIALGDRRKWEFDMASNALALDRMIPDDIGGYPINYGFVPQTVSYDGDPFDALVLGPPLPSGQLVRGIAVGVLFMEDEKGLDSKVVLSTIDAAGKPRHQLTASVQRDVTAYFQRYKRYEPEAFTRVPGWGLPADGLGLVRTTRTFFRQCRDRAGSSCAIALAPRDAPAPID